MSYVSHCLRVVTNLERSLEFYGHFADLTVIHRRIRADAAQEIAWIGSDGYPFRLILVEGPSAETSIGPYGHIGISCSDATEYRRLLARAQDELVLDGGPSAQPWPICEWFSILDPDANRVEISFGQDADPPNE